MIDGMIKQVVALLALVLGIYLCSGVATWLHSFLVQLESFPTNVALPLSFFLGFVLIVGVILLAGKILHRMISFTPLSIINHLAGGIIGLLLMILFISVVFNILEVVDHNSAILSPKIKVESLFYEVTKNIIPVAFPGDLFRLKNEIFT